MRQFVRSLVVATALLSTALVVADPAFAQRAVPRGGGGGGGGGGRSGGGGGTAAPRGGGHPSQGAPVVGRAVPRGSVPVHPGGGYGGYRPGYAYPPYWGGIGLGWGWGGYWGGYYGWGYWGPGWWGPGYASSMWWPGWGWWGAPALYYPPYWGITSDARFLVSPRNTEVYIDGALAGIVDQYDGVFQSLTLAPGTHQVSLFLDGHRRYDTNIYVAPVSTLKLRHTMEPLAAGASEDERPTPPPRRDPATVSATAMAIGPTAPPPGPREARPDAGEAGMLVIRVQPSDAEILIDGQRWQTPDATRPLEVRVPPGRVRIEIRKPGFTPFSTELSVLPGEVMPINVSLPSRGEQL